MIRSHSKSIAARLRLGAALTLTVPALVGSAAMAQLAGKGAISGTVMDPSGAAVPNATIVVTAVATGVATTVTSTSSGDYTVSLDPGAYSLTVTASGFQKLTQNNISVNALETQSLSPKLTIGGAGETVTVDTIPPQLETTNATLGGTMEQEMYAALPIEMGAYGQADQRRATDFAFLMPGVQGNNTSGNATTNTGIVNGSGSRGAVSDVYIDGVAFVRAGGNGDPRYVWTAISVDAVDQFQLQTSGYSAVYEGQGIQNYVVKHGGKDYHGSMYEFFRNTALDTWGFFRVSVNGSAPKKPIENSNEYGINLSGPLVPFGKWREKLFAYGNYNGFRYASETPTAITFPTLAQQQGNYQGVLPTTTQVASSFGFSSNSGTGLSYVAVTPAGMPVTTTAGCGTTGSSACAPIIGLYDPNSQATCTANSTSGACRYRYGFIPGAGKGPLGNPVIGPGGQARVDVIPSSQFSAVALRMQSLIPNASVNQSQLQNNYIAANKTGLTNFSTTERIDYVVTEKDRLTLLGAVGRQASSVPVGQTTSGRNVGPVPYNYGQAYAPKTAVGVVEYEHTFTPNLINQLKYGYARYNGPTFDADQQPAYAATAFGIGGTPSGAASTAFPFETWSGTNVPTNWGGAGPGTTIAQNYTLVDNVQWVKGKHNFTFGAQIAWLLYNVNNAPGGTSPLTLAYAQTETGGLSNGFTVASGSGHPYASFLLGQVHTASLTQYLQQVYGARFRPISPYVQDNWKVTSKLTLDLGVRWDYFPSVREVHDAGSFFSPTTPNPVTGINGALLFTGTGPNTCNCDTPVQKFYGNVGPRLGLAYQLDQNTVIRSSYGIMFTHGGAVGGGASSLGTLGYSGGLNATANGSDLSTAPLNAASNYTLPGFAAPLGAASGPAYGTGYTTTAGFTGSPQGVGYIDPYLGSRAPEFVNWTLGMQHQWTSAITTTMTYVGSQGHFLQTDGGNPRGFFADQLDPKYLYLGSHLSDTGAALTTDCATYSLSCPANFTSGQSLAQALKPFPFQSVSDSFAYVGNSNYHGLQLTANMRPQHGLSFMTNYTWSHSIDDGGTFRTGYAIPAGLIYNNPNGYAQDRIERTTSTSNQKHHVVVTGVYALPFGKEILASHAWERAILGGYKLSEIFQAYTGSPLAVTLSSANTNPAQSTATVSLNPAYTGGTARVGGRYGTGITSANAGSTKFIDTNAFVQTPSYLFGNAPRTAPYGLIGPGNLNLDLALVRTFPLGFEHTTLDFRAEWYNVTNHTFFAVASTAFGNSSFGTLTTNPNANRKAAQFSARLNF